jgi:hypothetical protein
MVSQAGDSDFTGRIVRVLRLDRTVFSEIEADTSATPQALMVVVVGALSTGIAGVIVALVSPLSSPYSTPVFGFIFGTLSALLGWLVTSLVIFLVGTLVFRGTATYGEMLRTIGFAYSPFLFGLLFGLPCVGLIALLIVPIWFFVLMYLAIREGLDLGNTRTILTIVVGIIAWYLVTGIIFAIQAALFPPSIR